MADGGLVTPLGSAVMPIQINGDVVTQKVVVADVEAPMVIGYDFLYENDCHLDMGRSTLTINNKEIHCQQNNQRNLFFRMFIHVPVNTVIPASSEVIVTADVENVDDTLLIETTNQKLLDQGILVARMLVNPKDGKVPIRLANISNKTQTVYKNTCAATCETVEKSETEEPGDKASDLAQEIEFPTHLQVV